MRLLLRVVVLYIVILLVGLLLIRLLGSSQQHTVASQLFSATDGTACPKPCLFGIVPGETSFDSALTVMNEHPLTRHMTKLNLPDPTYARFIDDETTVDILTISQNQQSQSSHPNSKTVIAVNIRYQLHFEPFSDPVGQTTLGDVVLVAGMPFRTQHVQTALITGDIFQTHYAEGQFSVSTWLSRGQHGKRVKLTDPVFTLSVTTKDRFNPPFQWSPWHGFSDLALYSESTIRYEGDN